MEKTTQLYTIDKVLQMEIPQFIFFWGNRKSAKGVTRTCFSQWYECDFVIDGIAYRCAEQFMMAEKARLFGDEENLQKILVAKTPKTMKALGRKVKGYDAELWNAHKFEIVVKGNIAKFSQNEDLKSFLRSTADKVLVEASPYDQIWGIGMKATDEGVNDPHQWKGTNLLGFALMQVRDLLTEMA